MKRIVFCLIIISSLHPSLSHAMIGATQESHSPCLRNISTIASLVHVPNGPEFLDQDVCIALRELSNALSRSYPSQRISVQQAYVPGDPEYGAGVAMLIGIAQKIGTNVQEMNGDELTEPLKFIGAASRFHGLTQDSENAAHFYLTRRSNYQVVATSIGDLIKDKR